MEKMSSGRAPPALEWKFSQAFGERAPGEEIHEVDIISAIEFDKKGDYLATGDCGGRVVLFERKDKEKKSPRKDLEASDSRPSLPPTYVYKTEFQSHDPEFDYLKSLDIKEGIVKIRWCPSPNNSLSILSANNRTIKLWKILERKVKKVIEMVPETVAISESALLGENSFTMNSSRPSTSDEIPLLTSSSAQQNLQGRSCMSMGDVNAARCRRIYANAHAYNIHSISNNSDGETFISADDLRINLWNLEVSNQCFSIIDMKPPQMEDLVEVMTTSEFHPTHCSILAYGSSRGFIRLVDMRRSALCDKGARILRDYDHGYKSFFSEMITSISDMKFAEDGIRILSRDLMNLKLWDLRMHASPVATYRIHEYIRPKLRELYNNDAIFDKFKCCLSKDGLHFASGSYSNTFKVFSYNDRMEDGTLLEATRNPNRILNSPSLSKVARLLPSLTKGHAWRGSESPSNDLIDGRHLDLNSKLIHLAWHPSNNLIVCAAVNSLYMYHA